MYTQDTRLSVNAQAFIERSAKIEGQKVGVSSISLAEIVYLVEKSRIPADAYAKMVDRLNDPLDVLEEVAVTQRVIDFLSSVSREQVPDLPDRIIAATARSEDVAVLTRDSRIRTSNVRCI